MRTLYFTLNTLFDDGLAQECADCPLCDDGECNAKDEQFTNTECKVVNNIIDKYKGLPKGVFFCDRAEVK